MTIREALAILIKAEDLDAAIDVRTHDGAQLGGVCTIDTGYTERNGDQYPPRVVLLDSARDVARAARDHAVAQCDGDEQLLEELREVGVIS